MDVFKELRSKQKQAILEKIEADKRYIKEVIPPIEMLKLTYTPFIVAEVVWDYADTLIDLSIITRRQETKRICRAIRELRNNYDKRRFQIINGDWRFNETKNMIALQETLNKEFSEMYIFFRNFMSEMYGLEANSLSLVATTYVTRTIIAALKGYTVIQENKISDVLGYKISPILPREIRQLNEVVIEFIGDCTLTEKAIEKQKVYAAELVDRISGAVFTVDNNDSINYVNKQNKE